MSPSTPGLIIVSCVKAMGGYLRLECLAGRRPRPIHRSHRGLADRSARFAHSPSDEGDSYRSLGQASLAKGLVFALERQWSAGLPVGEVRWSLGLRPEGNLRASHVKPALGQRPARAFSMTVHMSSTVSSMFSFTMVAAPSSRPASASSAAFSSR